MKGFLGFGKKEEAGIDMKDSRQEGKYIIQHDQEACIGCGACTALNPEDWTMESDGKAKLIDSVVNGTQIFEKSIDESHYERNKMAAEGCPVNCIHIINNETGKKII